MLSSHFGWASQVQVSLDHDDDPGGSSKMSRLTHRNTSEIMQPFDQDGSLARHNTRFKLSNIASLLHFCGLPTLRLFDTYDISN